MMIKQVLIFIIISFIVCYSIQLGLIMTCLTDCNCKITKKEFIKICFVPFYAIVLFVKAVIKTYKELED